MKFFIPKRWLVAGHLRAGIGSLVIRGLSLFLTLLSSVLLARALGPDQLGIYSFAFAIVALAGLPVQGGIPTLVLREIARTNQGQNWPRIRGVLRWAGQRIMIASALVIPLVGVGAWLLRDTLPPGALPVILSALVLIPLIALAQVRGATLRGLHRPILGQLPEGLFRPGGFLLLLSMVWVIGGTGLSAESAIGLHVLAALFAFILGAVFLWRVTPGDIRRVPADLTGHRDWSRAIWPLAMIASMQLILQNIDILMLGFWRSPAEVGLYKVAVAAANVALVGMTIVNLVLAPSFAQLHARAELSNLGRLAAKGAAVALAAALPVALLLTVAGHSMLRIFYGEAFLTAYEPMVILVIGQVVNAFYGSCVSLLNMSGNEHSTLRGLVVATLINVGLNCVLIPLYGVNGAALATLVSTVLWNVLLASAVRRLLGVSSTPLGLLTDNRP